MDCYEFMTREPHKRCEFCWTAELEYEARKRYSDIDKEVDAELNRNG